MPACVQLRDASWATERSERSVSTCEASRWSPDEDAAEAARQSLTGMVTPDTRGPDGWFGHEVPLADDGDALDRLLGFAGRDPGWSAGPGR